MSSSVFDVATIIGALDLIDQHLAQSVAWSPSAPEQVRLLAWRTEFAAEVRQLRHAAGLADNDAAVLNRFLAEKGFSYQFDPFSSPFEFGVVSTLREATRWPQIGRTVGLPAFDGATYRAFFLRYSGRYWDLDEGRRLVSLPWGPDDESKMWLVLGENLPDGSDGFALFEAALTAIQAVNGGVVSPYEGLTMPEESLAATTKLDWLVGMATTTNEPRIASAVQEAILRIDREGSEAKVQTSIGVAEMGFMERPPEIIVDRPHLVFWTDTAVPALPLAVARFETDAWVRSDEDGEPTAD